MQNSHASGAAERGNHGLLQWLHDFECRVTSTRIPRLPAVPHTQSGERNRYERYVGHAEPAIKVYQYTFRGRELARPETLRRLLNAAWRFVHGARSRRTLPVFVSRHRRAAVLFARRDAILDGPHRSLDEGPFLLVGGHPAVRCAAEPSTNR